MTPRGCAWGKRAKSRHSGRGCRGQQSARGRGRGSHVVSSAGLRSDLIDPAIDAHHGRIVKRTGDGSIVEFRSVVDAVVRCAIEVTLGGKPSNASMLDGQRPLVPAAVYAAYAQTGRAEAIKASASRGACT
jgi:class 3 adenylate cyclase